MSLSSRLRRLRNDRRPPSSAADHWPTSPAEDDVRERLHECGATESALDDLPLFRVEGERLEEWNDRGNRLCIAPGIPLAPEMVGSIVSGDATDALVVIASDVRDMAYLFARGARPTVFIGPESRLPHGELHCGDQSRVILDGYATATWHPTVDARNGGSVIARRDQLWATDVIISTDDMHRIEDADTGTRINAFGADIRLGAHVWLGREVMVFGGATVDHDTVVGARSLVRAHAFPPGCVLGGTPARILREGTTWTREDQP